MFEDEKQSYDDLDIASAYKKSASARERISEGRLAAKDYPEKGITP
jgi:hypothetical protein